MLIYHSRESIEAFLDAKKAEKYTIGFVPTMGALHSGHLSLIEISKRQNHLTVCSIFVNPTQFNNPNDLSQYPRTIDEDIAKLEAISCDILFLPEVKDVYPDGQKADAFNFGSLENVMEGEHRPGHFNGVGTVISRFFDMIKPNRAYFGEKDYQQYAIINKLAEIKNYAVKIVPCPILRETDGLAMSSRNVRLTSEEREDAPLIHRALSFARANFANLNIHELKVVVAKIIENSPHLKVEYVEIADAKTLLPVTHNTNYQHLRIFIAVFAGRVRLIDNEFLN